jgi:hypothetical protein
MVVICTKYAMQTAGKASIGIKRMCAKRRSAMQESSKTKAKDDWKPVIQTRVRC